jgi:hypothetical protein
MNMKIASTKFLAAIFLFTLVVVPLRAQTNRATGQEVPSSAHSLRVIVDPRVELLSLIFRLAGNPEYNMAKVKSYAEDADKQFGKFRDHAVVNLARELCSTHGVSYDAVMSMAIHLTDAEHLKLKLPLEPWPEGLDKRWTAPDVSNFLASAQQFVKDSSFQEFIEQHRPLYQTTVARMQTLMDKEAHLEWFDAYFGQRPQASFTVALGLLNGGGSYGPHFRAADGREELYCVLGVWQTDKQGLPEFTRDKLPIVVHEFCHSYANPLIERHLAELQASGDALFEQVAERMRSQAYGNGQTTLKESLVRACVIRYVRQYEGEEAARRAIQAEIRNGFLWMPEMSDLLGDYEAHRDQYPTLEDFSPRLVTFFAETAKNFPKTQTDLAGKRPKVVSMIPANGAQDVDPDLTTIQVVFDRPMAGKSWSLVGGGDHCPEAGKDAHYDVQRKIWTVPVKLKPDWSYEFMLNSENYKGFCSEEGVPLEPVSVTFKTVGQKGTGQTKSSPVHIDSKGIHIGGPEPVDISVPGGGLVAIIATLVPIVAILSVFGVPVAIIGLVFYFRYRRNKMVHETMRAMIEKGMPITPELIAQLRNRPSGSSNQPGRSRQRHLLPGLILTGVGTALLITNLGGNSGDGKLGWIVLFMGVAFLIVWFVERRDKNGDQPPKP